MTSNNQPAPLMDADQDGVLTTIVAMVNTFESGGFGITLTVGGSLITGVVISGKEYFQKFAEFWPQSAQGALGETLKKIFMQTAEEFGEEAKKHLEQDLSSDENVTSRLRFIHLKNARIVTPSGFVPSHPGLLWRGRISQVQAFSWGVLQIDG